MSKFNAVTENTMKTVNHEGHAAYRMNWKTKLMTQVLTSFFNEEKFYGDNSDEITELLRSGIIDDPKFVSNLAIFARREFNMRSISHVILGYLANIPQGKPYVKRTLKNIVLRGDDATEILSFYLNTFGKPIPNSLRKGLRDIFPTFDAYTLAKYKGEGKSVKMRDILCLCRPKPNNPEQSETWKKLLEGTLEPAYTWETELSAKGNKKEVWEELIASGKVGYMALLRNLRNILNAEPKNLKAVLEKIADPEAVRKSRQLPFRFLSAYRNIPSDSWFSKDAASALEKAAEASVENLPRIPGRTLIAIDVSGSMTYTPVSKNSDIKPKDIALLLGAIADKICEQSIVVTFDDYLSVATGVHTDNILARVSHAETNGGGTDMYLPMEYLLGDIPGEKYSKKMVADRIIILSDNECNYQFSEGRSIRGRYSGRHGDITVQSLVDKYRRTVNPDFWVHAIDLCGYGTQQFVGGKTNVVGGWSEKIFDFITLAEAGVDSLEKRISEYQPQKD